MTDDGGTLPVAADAVGLGREVGVPMRLANMAVILKKWCFFDRYPAQMADNGAVWAEP